MSDMSSLSHEYAATTDFSRQINDAVLILKKWYLKGTDQVDEQKLRSAREVLAETMRSLRRGLSDAPPVPHTRVIIPEDVLERIEEKYSHNLDYFRQDLTELEQALDSASALSVEQLELLDSICEAADASASETFRKLWRR
jgi:hypothetical protein